MEDLLPELLLERAEDVATDDDGFFWSPEKALLPPAAAVVPESPQKLPMEPNISLANDESPPPPPPPPPPPVVVVFDVDEPPLVEGAAAPTPLPKPLPRPLPPLRNELNAVSPSRESPRRESPRREVVAPDDDDEGGGGSLTLDNLLPCPEECPVVEVGCPNDEGPCPDEYPVEFTWPEALAERLLCPGESVGGVRLLVDDREEPCPETCRPESRPEGGWCPEPRP